MTIPGQGGQVPRRPDQSYTPSQGAVVSPGSTNVVRAREVIISGPSGSVVGVFVYAVGTTPGPGNPPVDSITRSATDPFGNAVQPDFVTYGSGGAYSQLTNAVLNFLSGSGEFAPASLTSFGQPGILTIQSGQMTVSDSAAALAVVSQAAGGITGGSVQMSAGQIILPSGGGPFVSNEFWNQATITNANNSGNNVNGFFYRLSTDNTVHMIWDITPTNNAGSTLFTLPSQYRPTHQQTVESGWYGTGPVAYNDTFAPRMQVSTGGVVTYQGTANLTTMNLCGSWKFSTTVN